MEHEERDTNEERQTDEPEEIEDLDVSKQKAEDVTGGALNYISPRYPGTGA